LMIAGKKNKPVFKACKRSGVCFTADSGRLNGTLFYVGCCLQGFCLSVFCVTVANG